MITLTIIISVLALLFMVLSGVSMLLLDPIIAILAIYLIYRLVKKYIFKK